MKLNIIFALITFIFASLAYHYHEASQSESIANLKLKSELDYLKQKIARTNEIIAENTTVKRELENESIKQQEQIKKLLADDTCADTAVPVRAAQWLHNRANQIRQPTDTSKPNK